jgi:hypothetical protein
MIHVRMRKKSTLLAAATKRRPAHTRREFLRSAAATGAVVMGSALLGKTLCSKGSAKTLKGTHG